MLWWIWRHWKATVAFRRQLRINPVHGHFGSKDNSVIPILFFANDWKCIVWCHVLVTKNSWSLLVKKRFQLINFNIINTWCHPLNVRNPNQVPRITEGKTHAHSASRRGTYPPPSEIRSIKAWKTARSNRWASTPRIGPRTPFCYRNSRRCSCRPVLTRAFLTLRKNRNSPQKTIYNNNQINDSYLERRDDEENQIVWYIRSSSTGFSLSQLRW